MRLPALPTHEDLPFEPGDFVPDALDAEAARQAAVGLGVFSLALGALELAAPRLLTRWLGLPGRTRLFRFHGLREVAVGVGLLTQKRKAPWLWARVLGDAVDLATLAMARPYDRKEAAGLAAGVTSVLAVAALDVLCAIRLSEAEED